MMHNSYLDNNATTFLDPRVAKKIQETLYVPLGNPSSPHTYGQRAKTLLSEARRKVSSFFKVKPQQIIFTSGGSEGAALCMKGILKNRLPRRVITSNVEHACVFEILEYWKTQGVDVHYLPAGLKGTVNLGDLLSAMTPETDLLVFIAANNETGVKLDLAGVAQIAEEKKVPLVIDGVALLGKDIFTIPTGVSAMFFSGHKIHAPQGIGFVYVAPRVRLTPQIPGGAQEFGMRGGTENMLGIIALAEAMELLSLELPNALGTMRSLRDGFEKSLLELPGVSINGLGERVANTSNLSFESIDGESFLIALDQAGISASLGSACSSGAIEPSRILTQMGLPLQRVRASLRFSLSRMTTVEEIEHAVSEIKRLLRQINRQSS